MTIDLKALSERISRAQFSQAEQDPDLMAIMDGYRNGGVDQSATAARMIEEHAAATVKLAEMVAALNLPEAGMRYLNELLFQHSYVVGLGDHIRFALAADAMDRGVKPMPMSLQ